MSYKVYTRLENSDEWHAVIDPKKSQTAFVDRIFDNLTEAEAFVKFLKKPDGFAKIEEINSVQE